MSLEILDEKGRVIFTVGDDGQFAYSRFEDMTEEDKDFIIQTAKDLSGDDSEGIRDFLNFKDNNGVFCS